LLVAEGPAGVVPRTVFVCREGPDRRLLAVTFIQSRNLAGSPPFPDLNGQCQALGYGSPESRFRDAQDRTLPCDVCD
jgi:hypothetical protein